MIFEEFLFIFIIEHTWYLLEITPGSDLQNHCSQNSEDHMWYRDQSWINLCKARYLLLVVSLQVSKVLNQAINNKNTVNTQASKMLNFMETE